MIQTHFASSDIVRLGSSYILNQSVQVVKNGNPNSQMVILFEFMKKLKHTVIRYLEQLRLFSDNKYTYLGKIGNC